MSQPINKSDDIEFDIWHEIQRRIDEHCRHNLKRPTRLYLGNLLEADLRSHPNFVQGLQYNVMPQITKINEIFGCRVYTVDNDYQHLELA